MIGLLPPAVIADSHASPDQVGIVLLIGYKTSKSNTVSKGHCALNSSSTQLTKPL